MSVPLNKRKKIVLLQSARKKGLKPFLRQAGLTFSDTFLARTHLIYRARAEDVLALETPVVEGLAFREAKSWQDLSGPVRERLMADQDYLTWGDPSWFDLGWRMWVGEFGDQLATMSWWRSREQADDFFIDLPENSELMWQSTSLPEYRGKSLFNAQRIHLMQWRAREGVREFYVCCEDFNITGRRNLPRQGFEYIGVTRRSKLTGRRRWRPLAGAS